MPELNNNKEEEETQENGGLRRVLLPAVDGESPTENGHVNGENGEMNGNGLGNGHTNGNGHMNGANGNGEPASANGSPVKAAKGAIPHSPLSKASSGPRSPRVRGSVEDDLGLLEVVQGGDDLSKKSSQQRWDLLRKEVNVTDTNTGKSKLRSSYEAMEGAATLLDAVKYLSDLSGKKGKEPPAPAVAKKNVKPILRPSGSYEEANMKPEDFARTQSEGPEVNTKNQRRKSQAAALVAASMMLQKKKVRFHIESKKKTGKFEISLPPIRPESHHSIQQWDFMFIIPLAYETWAFPFRLALRNPEFSIWLLVDWMADLWFIADIIVRSFVEIPDQKNLTRSQLFWRYMKKTFPGQIFPSIIFFFCSGFTGSIPLWLFWAASLPRFLPRVRRLRSYFKAMELNLDVDVSRLQLIKFTLVIFLSCHTVGSFYYWIARLLDFKENTWVGQFQTTMPGVFDVERSGLHEHYLALLYRGWIGLAPNSYRRPPQNWPEQLFSVLVMFMAMYLGAYLIGSVLPYIVKRDPVAEANAKRQSDFLAFASQKTLPADLVSNVLRYYDFQNSKATEKSGELSGMKLTRSLEVKVARKKYGPYIERNQGKDQAFYKTENTFVNAMVSALKEIFVMPGETFLRTGDVASELYFVADGTVQLMEGENVIREVRGDVVDMPCIVGDVSFFLGVPQHQSCRTRPDGDVRMLVLTREASEKLFAQYPDQNELILKNILASWNLDMRGNDLIANAEEDQEADKEQREIIIAALKRREGEAFAALNFAAENGDVEEVRRLIRQGADLGLKNYDGRTILHQACADGNFRVVEVLLENGADKNVKSRWGTTPIMEAIQAKQAQVVHLMLNARAEMLLDDPAGILCDWASSGDIDNLKVLLSNGVDPNVGDYDTRTPLHLAASEGHDKVVELLLTHGANVNMKDRWGGTPLQDAIKTGNSIVAGLLRSKGANLPDGVGVDEFCGAASAGDVPKLRILHECGVNPDEGDYDARTALHLASAEARLLAVSFLLQVSANVNAKDRWGATPMDDCVRGGTLYHMYCGKLLMAWGGEMGVSESTPEGQAALKRMDALEMEAVSALIKKLIASGLSDKKLNTATDEDLKITKSVSCEIIEAVMKYKEQLDPVKSTMDECLNNLDMLNDLLKQFMLTVAKCEEQVPRDITQYLLYDSVGDGADHGSKWSASMADMKKEMKKGKRTLHGLSSPMGHGQAHTEKLPERTPIVQQFLSELDQQELEADMLLKDDMDENVFALYDELDELVIKQERALSMGAGGRASIAKNLNRYLMQLTDVEEMLVMLEELFKHCANLSMGNTSSAGHAAVDHEGLTAVLASLGVDHLEPEDFDEMMDQALDHHSSSGIAVTAEALVCCSSKFRGALRSLDGLDMDGNELKYAYLKKCGGLRCLPYAWLRKNAEECEIKTIPQGSLLYKQGDVPDALYIVKSGTLVLRTMDVLTGEEKKEEVRDESVVPYFEFFTGDMLPYRITAAKDTTVIEVGIDAVKELFHQRPSLVKVVAKAIANDADVLIKKSQLLASASFVAGYKTLASGGWSDDDIDKICLSLRGHFEITRMPDGFGDAEQEGPQNTLLQDLQPGLKIVEDSWELFSYGAAEVDRTYFDGLDQFLGEVGTGFIVSMLSVFEDRETVDMQDWWMCWIEYLNSSGHVYERQNQDSEEKSEQSTADNEIKMLKTLDMMKTVMRRRKLRERMLSEEMQGRYEAAYVLTAGAVNDPLRRDKFKAFVSNLLAEDDIDAVHLHVFLEIFGKHKKNKFLSEKITWSWIRKILAEETRTISVHHEPFFVEGSTVFNPLSKGMQAWYSVVRLMAAYHFIVVPVRLTYEPFESISDVGLLCSDLVVDIFTILHVVVNFNTAFLNKKSRWVTKRAKITKHYLANGFYVEGLASFPTDWVVIGMGTSFRTGEWTRLLKLLFLRVVWVGLPGERGSVSGLGRLAVMAFCILHISACLWSGMGMSIEQPFTLGTSWLTAESAQSFIDGIGNGRDVTMWELYCMSLNWVATHTVSAIGNTTLYPKNYVEVVFAIMQLTVGMTFYRMVLGQISSIVMKADEKIIKTRAELGSLESYIVNNGLADDQQLAGEIRRHFFALQSMQIVDMADVFDSLNQSLQFELARLLCREPLGNAELFQGCSQNMLDRLSVFLREVQYGPEEEMFQEGDASEDMFIVTSGSVDKFIYDANGTESKNGSLRQGDTVGEVSFAFGMKRLFTARASAQSGCTCLRLLRSAYKQVLKMYPEDEDTVSQNSLVCFDRAKQEHGSSRAGSKKGTSSVGEDMNNLAMEAVDAEEKSLDSGGMGSSDGGADSDLENLIGGGLAQHIANLKMQLASKRTMQMLNAAHDNDCAAIKKLLKRGVSVNDADPSKRTALHIAASEGHVEVCKLLLDNMADVHLKDSQGSTPLNDAVREKRDAVSSLIREKIPGTTVQYEGAMGAVNICQAAYDGDLEHVKRLVENGVAVNSADYDQRTPLHLAACEGHFDVVKYLLDNNAYINARDRFAGTALQDAVRHEKTSVQKILKDGGCQIIGMDTAVRMCDAAATGNLHALQTLVENGVDANLPDYDSRTAIHLAASNGKVEILNFLLLVEPPISINPVDVTGGTPLDDAVRHEQIVAIKMLEVRKAMRQGDEGLKAETDIREAFVAKQAREIRKPMVELAVQNSLELKDSAILESFLKTICPSKDENAAVNGDDSDRAKSFTRAASTMERTVSASSAGDDDTKNSKMNLQMFDDLNRAYGKVMEELMIVQRTVEETIERQQQRAQRKKPQSIYDSDEASQEESEEGEHPPLPGALHAPRGLNANTSGSMRTSSIFSKGASEDRNRAVLLKVSMQLENLKFAATTVYRNMPVTPELVRALKFCCEPYTKRRDKLQQKILYCAALVQKLKEISRNDWQNAAAH